MPNNTNNTNTNTNVLTFSDILTQQTVNTITSNFTQYNSKKQLQTSTQFTQFTQDVQNFIVNLKNCFCFSVHNSLQYIVITMYFNNTKQYTFYVVNCSNNTVTQYTSIKLAKQFVNSNIQ